MPGVFLFLSLRRIEMQRWGRDRTILATTGLKARSAVISVSFHVHSVRGPLDGELRGSHENG